MSTPAKKATSSTAKKAPAKKAAASSSPTTSSKPGHGDVVTWESDDENGNAVTYVGVLVEDGLPLGADDEGKDQGKGARVAVLSDLRVIDPKQLKKL